MTRFSRRGPNVPPEHHAFQTSLPDVKHRAWAGFSGERRPAAVPPAPPRRLHPGLLDDLPFPEAPSRHRNAALPAVFRAAARMLGIGGRTPAEAPAAAVGASAPCVERRGAMEAAAHSLAEVSGRRLSTAA